MMKIIKLTLIILIIPFMVFSQSNPYLKYLPQEEWGKVGQIADSLIALQPKNFDNYYWKVRSLAELNSELEAIYFIKNTLSKNNIPHLKTLLLELYYENGMYKQAEPLLKELLNSNPNSFSLNKKKINIMEYNYKHLDAISLLENLIRKDSLNLFLITHLGDNYMKIDSVNRAQIYYEKAYELNPEDITLASKLGSAYLKTKPIKAIELCEGILRKDSLNGRFLKKAAMASLKLGKEKKALLYLKRSLASGDSSNYVLKNTGILLQQEGKFHESRILLEKAYQKDSIDLNLVYFLGLAMSNSPKQNRAIELFDRAELLLTPDTTICYLINKEKAKIYSYNEKHKKALNCYKRCLDYKPENFSTLFYIAYEYRQVGEKELAYKNYKLFLEAFQEKYGDKHEGKANVISLKRLAERNISELREELFFEGKLK